MITRKEVDTRIVLKITDEDGDTACVVLRPSDPRRSTDCGIIHPTPTGVILTREDLLVLHNALGRVLDDL